MLQKNKKNITFKKFQIYRNINFYLLIWKIMEYLIINLIKFDIKIKYDYTKLLVSVGDFSNLITNVHCHADKLVHDLQRAIQK